VANTAKSFRERKLEGVRDEIDGVCDLGAGTP
jgi:hypothetical protein